MENDMLRLYKDLTGKEGITDVKAKIENELYGQMREHFFGLMRIGEVMGYDKLYEEMKKSMEFLDQLKKQAKK